MRILVVEDEPKVASFIRRALEEESYAVDVCADGAGGLDWAQMVNYDLIVLDLMLPGLRPNSIYISSWTITAHIRVRRCNAG